MTKLSLLSIGKILFNYMNLVLIQTKDNNLYKFTTN